MTNSWGYLFHWTEIICILPDINLQVYFCPTELYMAQLIKSQHENERIPSNLFYLFIGVKAFPCGSVGKKTCLQCRTPGFDPWVGKIPWRRERLSTPVFWPREFHGLYSSWGHKESDTTEQLSLHFQASNNFSGNIGD